MHRGVFRLCAFHCNLPSCTIQNTWPMHPVRSRTFLNLASYLELESKLGSSSAVEGFSSVVDAIKTVAIIHTGRRLH